MWRNVYFAFRTMDTCKPKLAIAVDSYFPIEIYPQFPNSSSSNQHITIID